MKGEEPTTPAKKLAASARYPKGATELPNFGFELEFEGELALAVEADKENNSAARNVTSTQKDHGESSASVPSSSAKRKRLVKLALQMQPVAPPATTIVPNVRPLLKDEHRHHDKQKPLKLSTRPSPPASSNKRLVSPSRMAHLPYASSENTVQPKKPSLKVPSSCSSSSSSFHSRERRVALLPPPIAKTENMTSNNRNVVLSVADKRKFKQLVNKAKAFVKQGQHLEAVQALKKAQLLKPSEKLDNKIQSFEEKLQPLPSSSHWFFNAFTERYVMKGGFSLSKAMFARLFDYQKDGVAFLWQLHQNKKRPGGILGDDMGLGKTIQVISFLIGLFQMHAISHAMIVMPVSLLEHWREELQKWGTKTRVRVFHGTAKAKRDTELDAILSKGGILLTTYGMVLSNVEKMNELANGQAWDYVVLDEGHKIKNPSAKISKSCAKLNAQHRLILSGTPVQNNLKEMWALFNWACKGQLLGTLKDFQTEFEEVIVRGNHRKASAKEQMLGAQMAEALRQRIQPHFLRREKSQIFPSASSTSEPHADNTNEVEKEEAETNIVSEDSESEEQKDVMVANKKPPQLLVRKNDFIVWVHISPMQEQLYRSFLETEDVKLVLNKTKSPLAAITVMKKICDHPLLLRKEMKLCRHINFPPEFDTDISETCEIKSARTLERIIPLSGKLHFLVQLLANLKQEGHRVLIFSQSCKMLNIIQSVLIHEKYKFLRIDGSVTKTSDRQQRIRMFNEDPSYYCFLLTTQVGGLGINLTSADRVVIFDPAWNSRDDQAVDRAYRISQKRDVVVYRLITCATIEEKIYRKQVFKVALMKTLDNKANTVRYFTEMELKVMFQLGDTGESTTQRQLQRLHSHQRITDPTLDKHLEFLHSLGIFGISDHDLLFTDMTPEAMQALEQDDCDMEENESVSEAEDDSIEEMPSSEDTPDQLCSGDIALWKENKQHQDSVVAGSDDDIDAPQCNVVSQEEDPFEHVPIVVPPLPNDETDEELEDDEMLTQILRTIKKNKTTHNEGCCQPEEGVSPKQKEEHPLKESQEPITAEHQQDYIISASDEETNEAEPPEWFPPIVTTEKAVSVTFPDLTAEEIAHYNQYVQQAREYEEQDMMLEALASYLFALDVCDESPHLQSTILKLAYECNML